MIKNYANKVMDYEYNAFMTLMNVSVSKHLFDEHFTVLWANDYFYQLIGYTKDEYEASFHNHVDEYFKNDPDAVALMGEIITKAYQQQEPGYEFECPMQVKSGKTTWIRVTGRFTDEIFEGIPVIYTIYTDITDLKAMQRKLSEALKMAESANRAKSNFLSQMSHDIRTPMNAIIGMTEIAAMHINDPTKTQDCLKKIALSSQHLLGLINDVLDMSKIESGNIVINLEHVSLPSILENVVAIMQPTVKERKQQFDVRLLHVEHEELFSDPLRLRQIFINILSNASKFTPEGGKITFEVEELSCEMQESSLVRFTFSDPGMGIKPEFLPYLFDAFTRERDSRVDKTEGSGLGLAITHKLTELFGGTISVKSQLGEGTTFCVELPLKIDSLGWEPISCEGLKVLVVDNDIDVCKHLAQTLAELGAEALWCWNGADAVKTVAQERLSGQSFNLVLLDWQMPGMDGVQTSLAIRRQADADVPILITSAYDWVDIEAEAKSAGVNGFLQKPLFKSTLCSGIQRYLAGQLPVLQKITSPQLQGRRILLVEDNLLNREIAVELLSSLGASVETAADGAIGVAQFRQSSEGYYDLVLMDVQMPNMNGYEATRQIRTLPRQDSSTIPIIAMTADAFAEDVEATRKAGMNSHLPKPFNLDSLRKEIGRFL